MKKSRTKLIAMLKYSIVLIVLTVSSVQAHDSLDVKQKNESKRRSKIRQYEKAEIINGKPDEVFAFMDNIENTGKHMTKSSASMMGSKLSIEWLTDHKTGLGTTYRWKGKTMGMKMDFTVEVSKWIEGKKKVWGTVDNAKMIVIDWFEMDLIILPQGNEKSRVELGIYYTKHKSFPGFLLGKAYSKWCVKSMLRDTKKHFN